MVDLQLQRTRDLASLAAAFFVVLLTAVPLSQLLISAWDTQGLVYTTIHQITRTYSINIDLFVVVPVGVLLGWLLLFSLDDTKRIQAIILLASTAPFLMVLWSHDVWSVYVSWVELSPFVALGVIVGVITGAIDKILYGIRYREFPLAAQALFLTTTFSLIIGFLDLTLSSSPRTSQLVIYSTSILVFIGLFGSFIQYTNQRDVLVISPSGYRDSEAVLVTGLYDLAKSEYQTHVSEGGKELTEARANLVQNGEADPLETSIIFRFKPPGLFSRWSTIKTDGYDLQNLYDDEFNQVEQSLTPPKSVLGQFKSRIQNIVPVILGSSTLAGRLKTADLIIMIVPLSDPQIQQPLENDRLAESSPPDYLERYDRLCQAAGEGTDIIVATVDSELAVESYQEKRDKEVALENPEESTYAQFQFEIREWIGELIADSERTNDPFACSVVPLRNESSDADSEPIIANLNELLERLE